MKTQPNKILDALFRKIAQEREWNKTIKHLWDDALIEGATQAFWDLDKDFFNKNMKQVRRLVRRGQTEDLFWTLVERCEKEKEEGQSIWFYDKDGDAWIDMELAQLAEHWLTYEDLFPIDRNELQLPFDLCADCDCSHINRVCICAFEVCGKEIELPHDFRPRKGILWQLIKG